MEIKIGIQQAAREIVLESNDSPETIAKAVEAAISNGSMLALDDDKGRRVLVPGERIAYVEIGTAASRRVGFGG